MIPPIPVSTGTFRYTLDALILRSADLDRIAALVAHAAFTLGTAGQALFDPIRAEIRWEFERLAQELATVRADIDGVIATIDPSESNRVSIASGIPWSAIRPMSQWVIDQSPWESTATSFVPIHVVDRARNVAPPHNLAERMARIPDDGGDIRIDRFESPNGPRFEVYVSGTDFRDGPDNPWWFGSNVEFLASGQSRSLSATESALSEAGVTGTTPIVITGYSQGGIIAMALASSARYNVDAVFTIGTPTGIFPDQLNVPTVHVAHPQDPVPALGGDLRHSPGTTWIAHTQPRVEGTDAHLAETYGPTIDSIVAAKDPDLGRLEERVSAVANGSAAWFRASTTE
jgi:predicted esterase